MFSCCKLSCFTCVGLFDSKDCSPSGSSIHAISQARILEWVAIYFSRGSSLPRDQTSISCVSCISCIDRQVLTSRPLRQESEEVKSLSPVDSYNPIDCGRPGSSVPGILQASILEWVTIPFSGGSSQPRNCSQVSCTAGSFFTD